MSGAPVPCPVCGHGETLPFSTEQDFQYWSCTGCESLFVDPAVLARMDAGESLIDYASTYWIEELSAARGRSYGPSLARVAETLLYARRDVNVFMDIGAGPGYLLDACRMYMPASADKFFGVEKYPPPQATTHPNFIVGELANVQLTLDAGCCIEVIEHLTPKMVSGLLADLSRVSAPDALFLFNSGQPDYVKHEDTAYLDPTIRGHIVSYSVAGFDALARPHGFRAHTVPGKTWAFALEKNEQSSYALADRIWSPTAHNRAMLHDPVMGSVMYILGLESARAYR